MATQDFWFKRPLARLGITATLALGSVAVAVLPSSPALAASCSGSSCRGRDPQSAGCSPGAVTVSDSYTVLNSHNGWTAFAMEMRGSSTCKARWVRLTNDSTTDMSYGPVSEIRIERQIISPYGWFTADIYRKQIPLNNGGSWWSAMVENTPGADDRDRICYKWAYTDPDSASICTSTWYY